MKNKGLESLSRKIISLIRSLPYLEIENENVIN